MNKCRTKSSKYYNMKGSKSGIKHVCASCAQNGALEATMSHSTQGQSAYEHPVRRMMRLKQYGVTVRMHKVRMSILKVKVKVSLFVT